MDKNNSQTFKLYLFWLVEAMEKVDPNFRQHTVFMFDNASIHHTRSIHHTMGQLGVDFMYTAPYSMMIIPVEEMFSQLKNSNITDPGMKLTKKYFRENIRRISALILEVTEFAIRKLWRRSLVKMMQLLQLPDV